MLFSVCSMVVAAFVAEFGDAAVAAQKVGTQVETFLGVWRLDSRHLLMRLLVRTMELVSMIVWRKDIIQCWYSLYYGVLYVQLDGLLPSCDLWLLY